MSRAVSIKPPTAERVREVFSFEPNTGVFMRRVNSRRRPNSLAPVGGKPSAQGYSVVSLDGKTFLAHRLAWLYVYGEWPTEDIDHINGCKTDNRISNLRAVSRRVNMQNLRRPPRSKTADLPLGVVRTRRLLSKPYTASIHANGRRIHLGYFATPEEAGETYLAAKRRHHEGCTI